MCFAPQRRALFRHLNFQKWSDVGVLCAFWLGNVLRAATACTFPSLIWPQGAAPAALASLLFDPPEPQIIGKTQCFAAFLTFLPFRAPAPSFLWLFLFSDLLSSSLLCSDSSHLCFSICPYCRKFDFWTSFGKPTIPILRVIICYYKPTWIRGVFIGAETNRSWGIPSVTTIDRPDTSVSGWVATLVDWWCLSRTSHAMSVCLACSPVSLGCVDDMYWHYVWST